MAQDKLYKTLVYLVTVVGGYFELTPVDNSTITAKGAMVLTANRAGELEALSNKAQLPALVTLSDLLFDRHYVSYRVPVSTEAVAFVATYQMSPASVSAETYAGKAKSPVRVTVLS